jgi:Domain of unknown function (DUF4395)
MKQFGETVAGYDIPVLNEREIRGAAGILFLFVLIAFLQIMFSGNFLLIKFFIPFFMTDMAIRIFISPKFSPSLIIARYMVRNQTPLYVGAAQKKFAWYIGFALSTAMFIHIVLLNAYGIITGLSCLICMIFMFFELAFGICIGCKIYALLNKGEVKYCPGEVCELKDRQPIQETTPIQWLVVAIFVVLIAAMVYFFKDTFSIAPKELKEVLAG